MLLCFFFVSLLVLQSMAAEGFVHGVRKPVRQVAITRSKKPLHAMPVAVVATAQGAAGVAVGAATDMVGISTVSQLAAKVLGYLMGVGALFLYVPIIIKLRSEKNGDGMSLQTWVLNIVGFTIGVLYPLKKGFPLSTYVDGVVLTAEALAVMGLVCHYRGMSKHFSIGMGAYVACLLLALTLQVPMQFLTSLQIASIVMCNYANLPQIYVQYKTGKASWSWITAAMSTVGNGIKIFATKQLTNDPIILGGHFVGFVTNAILLTQTLMLGSGQKAADKPAAAE
jgi:mannose-P-dolichol utilization defect protein 1